jgi:hypothetical protein
MGLNYWNATHETMKKYGGHGPPCEGCGKEMYPLDDHGSFSCVCGREYDALPRIRPVLMPPQFTEEMPDSEKERIPMINRLLLGPTEKERKFMEKMLADSQAALEELRRMVERGEYPLKEEDPDA